jgi:hypothetical protein
MLLKVKLNNILHHFANSSPEHMEFSLAPFYLYEFHMVQARIIIDILQLFIFLSLQ